MAECVVLLDRDGTIIEDQHYPRFADKVVLTEGAIAALNTLSQKGYRLIVVSNQSGVGRGIIKDAEFKAVHARFAELLKAGGVKIEEFIYCFHRPDDDCQCRKPRAGLVPRKIGETPIDFSRSYVVGDTAVDLGLGEILGANSWLVMTGKGPKTLKDWNAAQKPVTFQIAQDLFEFAKLVPSTSDF